MANITLSVSDELLSAVKERAHEQQKSVNRLLNELLLREFSAQCADLADRIVLISRETNTNVSGYQWKREDAYEDA